MPTQPYMGVVLRDEQGEYRLHLSRHDELVTRLMNGDTGWVQYPTVLDGGELAFRLEDVKSVFYCPAEWCAARDAEKQAEKLEGGDD